MDEIGIMNKANLSIVFETTISSYAGHLEDPGMADLGKKDPGPRRSGLEKPDMEARSWNKSIGAQFARRLQNVYAIPQEKELDGISVLLTKLSEKLDSKA